MTRQPWICWRLAVSVVLCVLFLSLPYLYGKASDRWLEENGRARIVQQEMLSEEGQDNALAYTLYRNRFLTNNAIETSADLDQTRKLLLDQTETLEKEDVLSGYTAQRAREILAQPDAQTSSKLENGFSSVTYWVPDDEDKKGGTVRATLQEQSGLVTFYSVSTDKETEKLDTRLKAYRTYLGVETFSDWTDILETEKAVSSWSRTGQLYLFYRWENGSTVLGVTSQELDKQEVVP